MSGVQTMANYHNFLLRPIHQPKPCISRPLLDCHGSRSPLHPFTIPAWLYQIQIYGPSSKFICYFLWGGPGITWEVRGLLQLRQSDHFETLVLQHWLECYQSGVDRAFYGRCYNEVDRVKVKEVLLEVAALLFAIWSKEWVV